MKKFDRYSIRGILFSALAGLGILYELILSETAEWVVVVLYSLVAILGMMLIFIIKYPKE
jgi:predicted membrane channel-forming protein YqfA (hemolysin III family)